MRVCLAGAMVLATVAAVSKPEQAGRIDDSQTVADLIAYNQDHRDGFSIPGEGRIDRRQGTITRWEQPIPITFDPPIAGAKVRDAMAYWESVVGLSFALVRTGAEPRLAFRTAEAAELNVAIGLGLVYRTFANNRAKRAVVKIRSDFAECATQPPCEWLFRHELGHAIGILGHMKGGWLMGAPPMGTGASPREINMLRELYKLPHGARISPDGTWRVP